MSPDEKGAFLALTSATFSQLVAHRFATPDDVRIQPFLDRLRDQHDVPERDVELFGCMIRGVLGDEWELSLVADHRRAEIQLLLVSVLVADLGLDRDGVTRLIESARPMANLALDSANGAADEHPESPFRGSPRRRLRRVVAVAGSVLAVVLTVALIVSVLGGRDSELTTGPAKPEDFLEVYTTEYPVGLRGPTLAESVGTFVGPHFALRIGQVNITDSVDVAYAHLLGEDGAFSAAEGHEFVLFNVADDPTLEAPWGEDQVDADLVVDGVERSLESLPSPRETVVASVPEGAPVLLQVTDSDRAIQFDLRSGQVVSGAETYLTASGSLPSSLYRASAEVAYGSRLQRLRIELFSMGGTVDLVSHHPEFGWAEPGRAWLVVGPFMGRSAPSEVDPTYGYFDVGFDLDVRESVRLEVPGEGSLEPVRTWPRHAKLHEPMSPSEIVALFDVPASFREGQLVITPQGAIAVDTSSLTSAFGVRPHRDCGEPDIACVEWSEAPPTDSVSIGVSP